MYYFLYRRSKKSSKSEPWISKYEGRLLRAVVGSGGNIQDDNYGKNTQVNIEFFYFILEHN